MFMSWHTLRNVIVKSFFRDMLTVKYNGIFLRCTSLGYNRFVFPLEIKGNLSKFLNRQGVTINFVKRESIVCV